MNPFIGTLATINSTGKSTRIADLLEIDINGDRVLCRDNHIGRVVLLLILLIFGPILLTLLLFGPSVQAKDRLAIPIFGLISAFCTWQFAIQIQRIRRIEYRKGQSHLSFFMSIGSRSFDVDRKQIERFEVAWVAQGGEAASFMTLSIVGRGSERIVICAGAEKKIRKLAELLSELAPVAEIAKHPGKR